MATKKKKSPKQRFMPPSAFKVGRGIPQPDNNSPEFKRGGKVAIKKGRKSNGN